MLTTKVSEYEERAAECRALAAATNNTEHKAQLEEIALTWDSLAREREKKIARENHVGALTK